MAAWSGIIGLLAVLSLLAGCAPGSFHPYTYTGAALGGGAGALAGAAIDPGNPLRGAAIGGVMGGVLGGVAGSAMAPSQQPQGGYYYGPRYGSQYGYYDQNPGGGDGSYSPPPYYGSARPAYRYYPPPEAQGPDRYPN